jgi:hypothetical protein
MAQHTFGWKTTALQPEFVLRSLIASKTIRVSHYEFTRRHDLAIAADTNMAKGRNTSLATIEKGMEHVRG